jgi:peptidoglycan/LPS O-acetylase OafA/YrhL
MTGNNQNIGRIDELESVRGIAALMIVLFHMPRWYPPFHEFPLIRDAGFMVDLFFVLSGFVISRAYGDKILTGKDALRFQLLRFGRLYPVHLLFLAAFLLIEFARLVVAQHFGGALSGVGPFESNSMSALGLQLILGQALAPAPYWGTFNGPAWSISIEFYGYLLFAGIALLAQQRRVFVFVALFLAGCSMLGFSLIENSNISRFMCGFFAGCLVAEWLRGERQLTSGGVQLLAVLLLGVTLWFKALATPLVIVPASALLIAAIANGADSAVKRFLRMSTILRLGAWSYAIYMSHFLIIYLTVQAMNRFSSAPKLVVDGNTVPQPPVLIAFGVMAFVVLATLLVSGLTHAWVEQPLRQLSRRLVKARLGSFEETGFARQAGNARAEC